MAEVCRDFGRRLIRSWDEKAEKDEVKAFVEEAVVNFFKVSLLEPEAEAEKPKAKAKAKGKAVDVTVESKPKKTTKKKAEAEEEAPKKKGKKAVSRSPVTEEEFGSKIAKAAAVSKGKATAKPKCQAVTAKGTQCSKCAIDGGPFCSVHLKKVPAAAEEEDVADEPKAKGKGGKGLTKKSPPKHTHSLTSPPLKENPCELCDTHGMPFEVPEYEEDKAEVEADPDFVLGEEEFEDDDDDSGSEEEVEFDFGELD